MTRKIKKAGGTRPERRITIRSVQRNEPDVRKLAQVLIAFATAQAESDAEAEHRNLIAKAMTVTTKKLDVLKDRDEQ